jgi:hypothetical protein
LFELITFYLRFFLKTCPERSRRVIPPRVSKTIVAGLPAEAMIYIVNLSLFAFQGNEQTSQSH